ncbi:MAG: hypothetical protein JWR44_2198 [Hymenobacter sp.]|jgi:glucose-6-phosphate dehydrogenase assembly protein OpcA|nr:hypothetical protein [Hymenobacter sp.]
MAPGCWPSVQRQLLGQEGSKTNQEQQKLERIEVALAAACDEVGHQTAGAPQHQRDKAKDAFVGACEDVQYLVAHVRGAQAVSRNQVVVGHGRK